MAVRVLPVARWEAPRCRVCAQVGIREACVSPSWMRVSSHRAAQGVHVFCRVAVLRRVYVLLATLDPLVRRLLPRVRHRLVSTATVSAALLWLAM